MNNPMEITAIIIAALLSTGALGFYVRFDTRVTLLERMIDSSQVTSLHPRLTLVEAAVQEIKLSLQDLKLLPKISAQLENVMEGFRQMVPRKEVEARWKATDERLDTLEDDIRSLKD